MANKEGRREISVEAVRLFTRVDKQLDTFYEEIGLISKKKPSEPLNKFKLGFINQTIGKANELLGEEFRPFPDFTLFDIEASLPTASDVVMMLAHYRTAMESFKAAHSTYRDWNLPKPEPEATDEDDYEQDEEDLDDESDEFEEDEEDEESE